ERTGISASIFTAFGVAVLAGVASMGALVAAMITGEMESTKFARSIALTGDMAGITEGQFNAMAETIGGQIPGKVLMARTAMQDLISTGQFTGQTLADVARASVEFAQYSGETAAQAVKQFDTMKEGVAKWAEKTNEQYHFITAAQFEYIQTLENQGQVQAAADAAANDFYQHLAQSGTQNLGILEKAWLGLGAAIHGTWDELQNVGRASTLQDQISQLQMTEHSVRGNRKPYDDQIAALQAKLAAQEKAASDAAKNDQVQQLGIKAHNDLSQFLPPPDKVAAKVAKLKQDIAEALAANPIDPVALNLQKNLPAEIAKIQKEAGDKSAGGSLNKPDKNGFVLGGDDTGKLSVQLELMKQYASATKQSEAAVLALNIQAGKLKGFTAAQISELKARAAADDALAAKKAETAREGQYSNTLSGIQSKNSDLQRQLSQMQEFGAATKSTELDMINLQIAQGKLQGIPQAEIDSIRAAAKATDELQNKIADYGKTAPGGTQAAFKDYVDQATNAGAQMKKIWSDVFTGMENNLISVLEGGKAHWQEYAFSVVNDMLKMQVEVNILGPLIKALGNVGGGGGGSGWLSFAGSILSSFGPGGAGFGSFNGIGNSMGGGLSDLAIVAHQHALGGVMTNMGPMPLNRYANGGVANSPQVAMFGEGRGPEAYVPLPDGRSIPVSMKGSGAGGGVQNNVTNHISIASDGTSQTTPEQANRMSQGLTYAIQQELIRQHRDGGIFSSTGGVA
ncbi:MAG: phage tail length tape measure family protein, partial [Acidocella sp.]|nr:phage tail length tape measure family protein [Acidocella sp.]